MCVNNNDYYLPHLTPTEKVRLYSTKLVYLCIYFCFRKYYTTRYQILLL